jgi:hypothetical protein
MKANVVCAGLLLLVLTGGAIGAGNSANEVMPGCRAAAAESAARSRASEVLDRGFCLGAVAAIVHIDRDIFPPSSSNVGQWLRVIAQYIDKRPARLRENFFDLATEALKNTWPCRAQ